MKKNKPLLYAEISAGTWSYIVNENGNAIRVTIEGYGSCTPVEVLQKMINALTPEQYKKLWQQCETVRDVKD